MPKNQNPASPEPGHVTPLDINQKHPRVFYGWYLVGACVLITLYTGGVIHFGFTAVFEPIAEEFGWGYAQISLASSLRGLEMGLLAPLMGLLVDRVGPRKLIFTGSILISLGFLLLSQVSSIAAFYGAFALLAIGMSTCTGTVLLTAVNHWFRSKAGMATGIVTSGFGLGGLLIPVVTTLVDSFQWRAAMLIIGFGMLAIVLPLSLLVRHKPEQYGYQPDGDAMIAPELGDIHTPTTSPEINISARQALSNRPFWHVAIASMCHAFVVGAVVTHMMPYLSSLGIARSTSSLVALVLPVASIGGRLSSGWLSDRLGRRHIFATSFVLMTAGLLLYSQLTKGTLWMVVLFIIAFSLGWGFSVTSRIAVLREYFGRSSFGTILGFTSGIMMLGNMAGAPLAGWVFDNWGNYQGAWLGFAAVTLLGMVLTLTTPPPASARLSRPAA